MRDCFGHMNEKQKNAAERRVEIHVRDDPAVVRQLQARADAEGRSFAAEVRRVLRRSLAEDR